MAEGSRLVLKVDVDTLKGTLDGIPRLLALFAREGVRATFFFSVGPDSTGKAIRRIFQKGFVKKVLRASPASSYGLKTMLYGTLLPAPDIGRRSLAVARMQEAAAAGHECGLHGWDHVEWHDRVTSMGRVELEAVVRKGHERFSEIFGHPARVAAAPGWTTNSLAVELQEAAGVKVTSDTRLGVPFFPLRPDGLPATLLELPSTLPTLDELLAWDEFAGAEGREKTVDYLCSEVRTRPGLHVHSIHAEIEGGRPLSGLFGRQVAAWKQGGARFLTLGEAAEELLAEPLRIPVRALAFTTVRGRALPVATASV